jgi:tRNA uridine 5-carboxymethylaminomethyl modification enzyme
MQFPRHFDVIVVGGGHAGTEAALASARMGASTLLLTHSIETLGQMSCNPSIGGIGKGHLVKEIDALGGAMAAAADEAGIHFRILNGSKGPAVRATRAQADRVLYKAAIRRRLENQPNLSLFQAACDDLIVQGDRICGVVTQVGVRFDAACVVLTAGTFLDRRNSHRPRQPCRRPLWRGARANAVGSAEGAEAAARAAEDRHAAPARWPDHRLRQLVEQPGDGVGPSARTTTCPCSASSAIRVSIRARSLAGSPRPMPGRTTSFAPASRKAPCSPGLIDGVGPRYCPSIEDKVNRFAGKDSHQIFLEPEGLGTHEVYPNGISTSLPFSVQIEAVRSIAGLESAHIVRRATPSSTTTSTPGAAPSFETRSIAGCSSRADQRHDRLRGSGGAGPARGHQRGPASARRIAVGADARPGLSRRPRSTTWCPRASPSPTACSRAAPSTGSSCARTTPTCA